MKRLRQTLKLRTSSLDKDSIRLHSLYPKPYEEIPFLLGSSFTKSPKTINFGGNNKDKCKVVDFAKQKIDTHFTQIHNLYKNKQSEKQKKFTIKSKVSFKQRKSSQQSFFKQCFHERQSKLRQLNEQYLKGVVSEISKNCPAEDEQQSTPRQHKIIAEYNIIYEYRVEKLHYPFN